MTPVKKLWIFLAALYLTMRFGFTMQLDALGPYTSYILEFILVSIGLVISRKTIVADLGFQKPHILWLLPAAFAGFVVFKLAGLQELEVPFDLSNTEIIVFLLLVGPILEELLFRHFLWKPLEDLFNKPLVAWILTSLLFAYAHLHAIWFVPESYAGFIIYQSIYTLALGLSCGYFTYKWRSLTGAIAIHFMFNLGFWFGSVF